MDHATELAAAIDAADGLTLVLTGAGISLASGIPTFRDARVASIPPCPACGRPVRPHVLWFDELYTSHPDYQWHVVYAAGLPIRLLVCVGTSLAVGVTAFLQGAAAEAGAPVFLVDPGERPRDASRALVHLRARAEELLPEVLRMLSNSRQARVRTRRLPLRDTDTIGS